MEQQLQRMEHKTASEFAVLHINFAGHDEQLISKGIASSAE
jgi:hypothetical protein